VALEKPEILLKITDTTYLGVALLILQGQFMANEVVNKIVVGKKFGSVNKDFALPYDITEFTRTCN
jgi:hypothetical protein